MLQKPDIFTCYRHFIQGGRKDGTGANQVECQRAGAVEGVARHRTRLSPTDRSGPAAPADRPPRATASAASRSRRPDRASVSRRVEIQRRLNGSHWLLFRGRYLTLRTAAQRRYDRRLLPAYGLQESPIQNPRHTRRSKPNTSRLLIIPGGSLGGGHFYFALTASEYALRLGIWAA